ncbi:M23 family metallopeptidase [Jeongeupia sp. USM3]|uniref:M23 family metallopeptidase n=1 Tax=Jeongeupia sp. USM3 TaxID=1906741 RepID=UPI00089DEB21|nr:M23 family metallopeptidase [Jeongeupia sp. USM3]AOY00087.1 hypothetical protein BJP62_06265 [Jeongeupia sp. USM3]
MIYKNTPIEWPLDSNVIRRGSVGNTFGMVRNGGTRAHQGWDFFAPAGTPCYAVAAGKVVFAGDRGDFGGMVVIELAGLGLYAAYAHLSRIDVKQGQAVTLGQRVGTTGCTGNAAGMVGADQHLHFEIRTEPLPGLGLGGRISPLQVFGVCPMTKAEVRHA